MGIVALVGLTYEFNLFVTNVITMIGLAVGIDYSLFIVYRYRDERRGGLEKMDAIARAGATASRAVFFSGFTVVLALTGMLLISYVLRLGPTDRSSTPPTGPRQCPGGRSGSGAVPRGT